MKAQKRQGSGNVPRQQQPNEKGGKEKQNQQEHSQQVQSQQEQGGGKRQPQNLQNPRYSPGKQGR